MKKDFCPVVVVDLEKLQQDCNVNLSPWLASYDNFTSIAAPYNPNIVRLFYYNMQTANILNSDDELVEERVTTAVRGITFTLSASILNTILQINNPPHVSTPTYSNQEIFATLRPNEPFPDNQSHTLSFKPGSMPPLNRVLWYVYSRNFVQKGGSFTHFSQKDYRFFTAFVKKHPLNLGHWIFQEMIRFKFSSRRPSHIPFSSLISVILYYHKIWYVGPPNSMKYPPYFGKAQLNLMKLNFEEGSGQSRAPSRSQTRASQPRAQEAQSPAPPPSTLPSDIDSRVKAIVDAAIASLSIRLEFEIGKLGHEIRQGHHAMKEQISNLQDQNMELLTKVDKIMAHLKIGSSTAPGSSPPQTDPEPSSSSPSFTFTSPQHHTSSPIPSTPTTEVLPTTPQHTPSTEILHLSPTPTTQPLPTSPPSTPILDPLPDSHVSAPSLFEDDKGGEKGKKGTQE